MTIKQFIKKLEKNMEKDFVLLTNKDGYEIEDDEVVLCGEDEEECFAFKIIKVE